MVPAYVALAYEAKPHLMAESMWPVARSVGWSAALPARLPVADLGSQYTFCRPAYLWPDSQPDGCLSLLARSLKPNALRAARSLDYDEQAPSLSLGLTSVEMPVRDIYFAH